MMEILIIVGLIILIISVIIYLFTDLHGLDFLLGILGAYILSSGIMMHQMMR
jgi:hypothetical protein